MSANIALQEFRGTLGDAPYRGIRKTEEEYGLASMQALQHDTACFE